jgi:hypothetical protein
MRSWKLCSGDPLSLVLAADSQLNKVDYPNDHIWGLSLEGGDPSALSIQTTYGLRAHWMRFFGRFFLDGKPYVDPQEFYSQPCLTSFYPNYLSLSYSPWHGLGVVSEFWVPGSQVLAGRFRLVNTLKVEYPLRFEWIGVLNPLGEGEQITAKTMDMVTVLHGKSGSLAPVCFMTGGPIVGSGPYSGLALDILIEPGEVKEVSWALASLADERHSLDIARRTVGRGWDANIARLEILNESRTVHFYTGNPDWDAALAISQRVGAGLIFPRSVKLPDHSFVLSRQPDHGYSMCGDGSDYGYLWNGQSALDLYFLTGVLLTGSEEVIKGAINNFLAVQEESGWIDWKPGLAGQRSCQMAQPLLASVICKVGAVLVNDHSWLRDIFPRLLAFFNHWFHPINDPDQDGFPSWLSSMQSGFEDSPMYGLFNPESQGAAINYLKSPALGAMLLNECRCLIKIAGKLDEQSDAAALCERYDKLLANIESCWDPHDEIYRYHDAAHHVGGSAPFTISFQGDGQFTAAHSFTSPHRLQLRLAAADDHTRAAKVIIHGETDLGETSETLKPIDIRWVKQIGRATTKALFHRVELLEVQGVGPECQVNLSAVDYSPEDLSLFLPLWAKVPDLYRAKTIIEQRLLPRYLSCIGLTLCPAEFQNDDYPITSSVSLAWSRLIVEGLLAYGYRIMAAEIMGRNLDAVAHCLKDERSFLAYYHPSRNGGWGERNHLHGLFPVQLFLEVLGIRFVSHREVIVEGEHPFPKPMRVQFRGIIVERRASETDVIFPGEHLTTVYGAGPHRVALE